VSCGIYSRAQRRQKIERYRLKKKTRQFNKKVIDYQCRKDYADKRPRISGRFMSTAQMAELRAKGEGELPQKEEKTAKPKDSTTPAPQIEQQGGNTNLLSTIMGTGLTPEQTQVFLSLLAAASMSRSV